MRKVLWIVILMVIAGLVAGGWFYLTRPQQRLPEGTKYLVSLGDSVAAGDGLPAGSSPEDQACGRSDLAYPVLLAKQLKLPLLQYACSGASVPAGLTGEQVTATVTLPAQIEAAKPHLRGNVVVLTIGANDVGWSDLLLRCLQTACDDPAAVYTQSINDLIKNLDDALAQIQAQKPAKLLLNTYYHPVESTDACLATFGISSAKVAWVLDREAELNRIVTTQAEKHGGTAVTLDFKGHELCNLVNSYIQGPSAVSPLHPTASGQQRIAQQDAAAL